MKFKVNQFVYYGTEQVQITALYPDGRAHISNMNMPFCGSICTMVDLRALTTKPKDFKIWNGRGSGIWRRGHFFIAAHTKRDAARMLAMASAILADANQPGFDFLINRAIREMNVFFAEGCWGTRMKNIHPVYGLWATMEHVGDPVKIL